MESRGYNYFQIPDANLDEIVYSNKNLKVNNEYMLNTIVKMLLIKTLKNTKNSKEIVNATISYLVKEFEMKKSAEVTRVQTTDKTAGIIDPLKLHKYKISEDIFKRLSVIPDAKKPRDDFIT